MYLNKIETEGVPANTVTINGWTYMRVTDSVVNAWHDVVENHFDQLCEEVIPGGLCESIFVVDEALTGGEARKQIEEMEEEERREQQEIEAEREAEEYAYQQAKGHD